MIKRSLAVMGIWLTLDGKVSPEEQKQIDQAKELSARIKALKPEDANSSTPVFGAPAAYWLDLRGYDPTELPGNSNSRCSSCRVSAIIK